MAPSQVSGMKMRNLLFGVILGLLAVVHSTPVNTVTQNPTKAEDEVMREAVTDGFLVEHFSPSLTTESPKGHTTVSQQPSSDSTESDAIEGSAGETSDASTTSVSLQFSTTTLSVSHAQTSTVVPGDRDDSSSDSTTSQSPQSSFTTSSVPNEAQSSVTPDHISTSQTTDPAVSSFHFLSTQSSDSGSGDGGMLDLHSTTASSMTSSSNTEASTASSTSTTEFSTASSTSMAAFIGTVTIARSEGSGEGTGEESGSGMEISTVPTTTESLLRNANVRNNNFAAVKPSKVEQNVNDPEPQNKGQNTPGWIIIVGFIVGLAALVMLFVAIATRDKWNGPSKASQQETKTNASNQQRELEMETFIHKDNPKENGKASEYTVIPLDELPEKYSSH